MQDREWQEQRRAAKRAMRKSARNATRQKYGTLTAGLIILLIGGGLLLRQMDIYIPRWLFSWPMILIIVGLFAGIQSSFRDFAWLIIFGIGSFFLVGKILPGNDIDRYAIPVVVMGVGLVVLLVPWRKKKHPRGPYLTDGPTEQPIEPGESAEPGVPSTTDYASAQTEDFVDATSIFGNVKKVIYSKNFRGGEVVSIFGGAELNLSRADFTGPIVIEMVQIFGGAKLIIPPHWEVRSEAVAIFGGIEDKRPPQSITSAGKILILQGTVLFGGIEIKSY
jgi:predicted membrane protein